MSLSSESRINDLKVILITGGCGFIGSNLVIYMVKKYPSITFINLDKISYCSNLRNLDEVQDAPNYIFRKIDLLEMDQVHSLFQEFSSKGTPIDGIMHLAAYTDVSTSFYHSISYTKNNVIGTHILLEIANKFKIKCFLEINTDEIYGDQLGVSNESALPDPTNPYSASKTASFYITRSYYHSFKLPVITLRLNNIYGRYQYPEKVIPKFCLRILNGKKCQIQGEGLQTRSFLHVEDACRAFELVLFNGKIGEVYNSGSGQECSVMELAKRIITHLKPGEKLEDWIEYIEDRHFNDKRYLICSEKIKQLGWSQQISFDEGLPQVIEWYKQNTDRWDPTIYS